MVAIRQMRNILMELRKACQHPYLSAPELENEDAAEEEQHRQLTNGSGKLAFLKLLLPKLKERGHRVLLFSQFKIALDRIEDFLYGEGYKFLRLDGDVQQAKRQKAMDAFNAPDSEYFIFLLTTRAGGVGINLATADTVIIHDPDFNPHMDLQAIARSHRYGQKKRVLVFKLMTKNSVEEQIILNGKKKMVLDHLVVQQMGKENEEGDIDDLLLRGAAALYDANEDGVAASDIRYTSKDVDELIDKVEADAETEAREMEARDKAKASEQVEEEPVKAKETMSFGFAKIWEADRNRLQELGEEDRLEDMDANAWQLVVDNARKAREAERLAMMENGRAKRAAATTVKYGPIRPDHGAQSASDDNTPKKEKRKYNKRRKAGTSSEDADFVDDLDSTDSDESMGSVPDIGSLLDQDGNPIVLRGLVAGEALNKRQKIAAYRANQLLLQQQQQQQLQAQQGGETQDGQLPPGTVQTIHLSRKPRDKKETAEERAIRKANRRAEKMAARRQKYDSIMASHATLHPADTTSVPEPYRGVQQPQVIEQSTVVLDTVTIQSAREICQWLYHMLREFGHTASLSTWAEMALPEMPAGQREEIYRRLAGQVDAELFRLSQPAYFNRWDHCKMVLLLLRNGYPIIPDSTESLGEDSRYPSLPKEDAYRSSRPREIARAIDVRPTPHAQVPAATVAPAASGAAPLQANGQAGPSSRPRSPILQDESTRRDLFDVLMDNADRAEQQKCPHCFGNHALKECTEYMSAPVLEKIREAVLERGANPNLDKKTVKQIDKMLRLDAAGNTSSPQSLPTQVQVKLGGDQVAGRSSPSVSQIDQTEITRSSHMPSSQPLREDNGRSTPVAPPQLEQKGSRSKTVMSRQSFGNGSSVHAAIVVDDDDDENVDHRPIKRSGCPICQSGQNHPAKNCPVVHQGPDAIKAAMRRFEPSDPLWLVLRTSFEEQSPNDAPKSSQAHLCAFCEKPCGRTIRSCAGSNGGRKALKDRIKRLESIRQDGSPRSSEHAKNLVEELYDCYLKWPRSEPV